MVVVVVVVPVLGLGLPLLLLPVLLDPFATSGAPE